MSGWAAINGSRIVTALLERLFRFLCAPHQFQKIAYIVMAFCNVLLEPSVLAFVTGQVRADLERVLVCCERIRPRADHVGDHSHALIGVSQIGSEPWITRVLGDEFLIIIQRRFAATSYAVAP